MSDDVWSRWLLERRPRSPELAERFASGAAPRRQARDVRADQFVRRPRPGQRLADDTSFTDVKLDHGA